MFDEVFHANELHTDAEFSIIDITGKRVSFRTITLYQGVNSFPTNEPLESGVYWISLTYGTSSKTLKLVVKN